MPPKPPAPTLSWPVHRDLACLLTRWRAWTRAVGRDAFGLLLALEALRLESPAGDTFRYRDLEKALDVSSPTLRRWLASLRTAGLLATTPVPGTNRTEVTFEIRATTPLPARNASTRHRHGRSPGPLTLERTSRRRH